MQESWWTRAQAFAFFIVGYVLGPVFCVVALVLVAPALIPAVHAAVGQGRRGTFTARHQDCEKVCTWSGGFVSDDGAMRLKDVHLDSNKPHRVGNSLPVLYEGETDPPAVYLARGSLDWFWILVIILMTSGFLVSWLASDARELMTLQRARRHRRSG